MLPGEGVGPLRGELIVERHRVMVVEKNEVVANPQFQPLFDDESVFDGTGYWPDVHDFIRANEVFSLHVCVGYYVVGCWLKISRAGHSAPDFSHHRGMPRRIPNDFDRDVGDALEGE